MSFTVKSIAWDEQTDECIDLVIADRNGHIVYDLQRGGANNTKVQEAQQPIAVVDNEQLLVDFCKNAKAKGADEANLKEFYKYWHGRIKNNTFSGTINPYNLWKKKYGEL